MIGWVRFESTWKSILKKLFVVASFLSAFGVSGFAQTAPARTPAESGAKLVAEHDAAYLKAHPGGAKASTPKAHSTTKHAKNNKSAKKSQHTKKSQHHNKPKTT